MKMVMYSIHNLFLKEFPADLISLPRDEANIEFRRLE